MNTEKLVKSVNTHTQNIIDLNSSLESKMNKNGILNMSNMGQDVKEAMTGGSVAVVGKNAVLSETIVDGQVIESKTSFYKKTANIKYKNIEKQGYGINSNTGSEYVNVNLIVSDFINIENIQNLSLQKFDSNLLPIVSTDIISVAFYDTAKTFISFSDLRCNNTLVVPPNSVYTKYQYHVNYISNIYNLLTKSTLLNQYVRPYVFEEMDDIDDKFDSVKKGTYFDDESITPSKTTFFENKLNLFNKDTIGIGAVYKDSGNIGTGFTNWRYSDYISVKQGDVIYFSNDKSPLIVHTGAFYTTSKIYNTGFNDISTVTAPCDGFVRFSRDGGFPVKFQCETGEISEYKEYGVVDSYINPQYIKDGSSIEKPYANKKYLLLGDSITALDKTPTGWVGYFAPLVKASKTVNVAVAGATWKDYSDTGTYDGNPTPNNHLNVIGNQVQKVINQKNSGNVDYADFDVIIIACGTNDPFNRITETKDIVEDEFITSYTTGNYTVKPLADVNRKSFPGIMRYTFEKLYELYPNAIFFVSTPLQETFENYLDIKAKGDLIDYIADRLSINTINARRCGILNTYEYPNTNKRDLVDGIHPNVNGAKKIGEYITRDIINYFNN